MGYDIRFSAEARQHLRDMSARERSIVISKIEASLADRPTRETRNLKSMIPNPLAGYELRIGRLRVFFDVNEAERIVLILAIGHKQGNRLVIGGEEVEL